jgi:ABC-type Zn2+ transport system substrate-binding protein/surface adhesin
MKLAVRAAATLSWALALSPVAGEVSAMVVDHRPRHHNHHGRKSALQQASKPKGSDGMPHLPAVSSMLGTASATLKSISSQANTLEARVMQVQTENEAKMARQKSVFDRRLKAQEEANRDVVSENKQISKDISEINTHNVALRKHAKELQVDNRLLRIELQTFQTKLGVSRDFVATALASTDDSKAKDLLILKEAKKEDHEDREEDDDSDDRDEDGDNSGKDDDDDDDGDDAGPSFLALASRTQKSAEADVQDAQLDDFEGDGEKKPKTLNPNDLLKVLQKGVENLAVEEKEGEAKLKAMFLSDFQGGSRHHIALISQQKTLNATRASVKQRENLLTAAEAHLERTKSHLEQRLRGLGLFLQKLAHVALAPAAEVPKMVKTLPSAVSLPSMKDVNKKVHV